MRILARSLAAVVMVCLHDGAAAQSPLTLPDVLARARAQAPQVLSARLALDEVRARVPSSTLRMQSNPEVDVAVGNREGAVSRYTELDVGVSQGFEPGSRRRARVDQVDASVLHGAAQLEEAIRVAVRDAAAAYYRVIHADERIRLIDAAREIARSGHATAERRYRVGELAVLDVNLARVALARIDAEREGAEADRGLALAELQQLLQLDEITVTGTLTAPDPPDIATVLRTAADRPELRAHAAALREAEAGVRAGLSFTQPEFGLGVRYAREEGDQIVLGSLRVTLPLFSRGQAQYDSESARAARVRMELALAGARIEREVRSAHAAYSRRLNAVRLLQRDALPGLDENVQLMARSFEVGQIGLPELLLLQREILEVRMQYLDSLAEAVLARVHLDASAGILR